MIIKNGNIFHEQGAFVEGSLYIKGDKIAGYKGAGDVADEIVIDATGLEDGSYKLGGLDINVKGNLATLTEGETLAGSVTNLMDCVRKVVREMGIPLESAIKCAAVNPAKAIGIYDKYGSLAVGKQANIVILDENLEIRYVIKDGDKSIPI